MNMPFRCQLVNETGDVLKVHLTEDHSAFMDVLNTLCGAYPVEWIGDNPHDKLIECTPALKERIMDIAGKYADKSKNLSLLSDFFNRQPDNAVVAFLREGVCKTVSEEHVVKARRIVLRANYDLCDGLKADVFRMEDNIEDGMPFSLFMFLSDGVASLKALGKNYPKVFRELLIASLKPVLSFGNKDIRNSESFWRLGDLRKLAESDTVKPTAVANLIKGEIRKLAKYDADTVVVFGIIENADINQLTNLKEACVYARSHDSHIGYYDYLMATDRALYLDGYRRRRFTDLGFEYRIKGKGGVCRFCNQTWKDGATFKNDPHAISYFFGNQNLLGGSECDNCNSFFWP